MADRIERYLGRLEAELEGRINDARLEEILVEVEGHLRESEEGWRELGEPDELANRLAVDGFGGLESLSFHVQKSKGGEYSAKVWGNIAMASSFVLVISLVIVSALVSSMTLAMIGVVLPAMLCLLASFFGRMRILRGVGIGFLAGVIGLMILFMPLGRAAITNGLPTLGMSLGDAGVMCGGAVQSSYSTRLELQRAREAVKESEAFLSVAHEGPPTLFHLSRTRADQKVMLIKVFDGGYGYSYTKDYAKARDSWLKHGDAFVGKMRENEVRARYRFHQAMEMDHASFRQRIVPVLVALGILVGSGGVLLGFVVGCGIGLRKFVDLVELVLKKVRRYGIQK